MTVERGMEVEYTLPPIDILDLGKSSTVTATAKVPLDVCVAENLIVHVLYN